MRAPHLYVAFLFLALMGLHPLVAQDDLRKINPWIIEATADGNLAEFLVVMTEQADLSMAVELKSKEAKGLFVHRTLLSVADRTQASLQQWLVEHRVPHRRFVIFNGFWVLGDRAVALAIAGRKDVTLLEGNPRSHGRATVEGTFPALQTAPPLTPELAVTATNAPLVWSLGFHGEGVVIGSQDTGVQWDHPALIASYRGYDGTAVDHSLSWHDSVHFAFLSCGPDNQTPCANDNHGTFTLGLAVGDDGFGNQIGMAPLSRWMCARNSEDGIGSPASYIESFEWFLAPYVFGSSSASGDPLLAPDVTNNAWLCEPTYGCTTSTLHLAVMAQRAAGIVTVAAAGNHGPACSTISSPPAIYDEVLTVGGYGASTGVLASFSSRGPVTSDGSGRMKPDLCAPGTAIRSSVTPSLFQAGLNGTSGSCSFVTGAVALLLSAHPDLKGQVDLVEQVLLDTATPVATLSCSSTGTTNNLYGAGILDVWAAVQSVRRFSLSSQPERTGSPGHDVHHVVAIQNSGYVDETVTLSVTGPGGWTCPSSLGPIPPATIAVFSVVVSIPAGATEGQMFQHTVAASSSRLAFANDAIILTTRVVTDAPVLQLSQPTGPSGGIVVRHENLIPGHEYYNVFSFDPCPGGIGTGPWLGLCTASLETLIAQILLPPSAPPIHYVASSTSHEFGPYYLTSGLSVAGVLFDHTGQVLQGVSPVAAYVVQ